MNRAHPSATIAEAFQFCPKCATENPSPGQVPFKCAACGLSNFFGPVAAVGGLVLNENDELLLVRRARDPGKGKWGLPGGFVDSGEDVEQAMRREVKEETGLRVIEPKYLFSAPNQYVYQGYCAPVLDFFFTCRVASDQVLRLDPDELQECVWTHPSTDYLNQLAFESNRRAIEFWLAQQS